MQFLVAALGKYTEPSEAAAMADRLLEEFDKRWEYDNDANSWVERMKETSDAK